MEYQQSIASHQYIPHFYAGILVSSFSPVDYGNLHYRILEKENMYALKSHLEIMMHI
jgi:hypothetical protein